MKGMGTVRKWAIAVAVCMAMLCLPGYSEPTPEQIAERTRLLLEAIKKDDIKWVELLIKAGADVNARIGTGTWTTPLVAALESGVYDESGLNDIAELLVKAGADKDAALIVAIQKDNAHLTDQLIKAGANPNATDRRKWSALNYALIMSNFSYNRTIAEQLIKAGADSDASLIWAVKNVPFPYEAVKLLIELGANVNAKDSEGILALTYAIKREDDATADLLRAAGARE